ncbi:MAG: CHAP domain-containing protein [Acetobacter papayae]
MRNGQPKTLKLKLAVLSFCSAVLSVSGVAKAATHKAPTHHAVTSASHGNAGAHHGIHHVTSRHHGGGHVIQCVAYAKSASDVMLRGNARDWWHNAAGVYERGQAPEAGSVLNFRGTRRMPLGHVAVVRNVVDSRTIVIDQSHWAQAGVSHNVSVIDVSANNDWSAVRVALNKNSGTYGSIYPTYGFIYPRSPGAAPAAQIASTTPQSQRDAVMTAWAKKTAGATTQVAQAP